MQHHNQITIAELIEGVDPQELTLAGALRLFENVYMASRNLGAKTRREYRTDVAQLISFLAKGGTTKPEKVGLADLQGFLAELDAKGLTGITRRRKTSSIKSFFGFLHSNGLVSNDPSKQLIPPEREHKEPRFLTTQEYRALLRACAYHTRDAAIIELILQTGIRLSEAARLTIDDVELPERINRNPANTGSITIRGKRRKQRTLPLNYKACRAIKAWLIARPDVESSALFVSEFRQPLGPRGIQKTVAKYLKDAGIKNASVHTLRHTFGTHHVAKGTDLRTVQEALGHASLQTTSIYVSTAKEAMKRDLQEHAL